MSEKISDVPNYTCTSLSIGSPWDFPVLREGHEIIRGLPIDDRMSQNSKIYKLFIKCSLILNPSPIEQHV